ncbi:MAG: anti-sigma regulatory factor [Candidatus Odinarchaeota archaeon]
MLQEEIVPIIIESDIVTVRRVARTIAGELGFGMTDTTRIITATSELARNVYQYAGKGTVILRVINYEQKKGIELIFEDKGPGIPDIDRAMEAGYSTSGGFGLGLPGTKRLMDEMEIISEINRGTKVTIRKWLRMT